MLKKAKIRELCFGFSSWKRHLDKRADSKGQALVEFTLIFVLFLAIAWIPADFGLAFFTGQLAQNASREAARIAAADPGLVSIPRTGTCTMPCSGEPADSILGAAAARVSNALMPGATIAVDYDAAGPLCNRQVTVSIDGTYNFFFYQFLNFLGASVDPSVPITRETQMRWEHQESCLS